MKRHPVRLPSGVFPEIGVADRPDAGCRMPTYLKGFLRKPGRTFLSHL
ncbi:MAG: hypothetical protein ABSE95_12980 [Thermodesulfobacteriota bacterium]